MPTRRRPPTRRAAFTLTELVLVAAMVVVLAAFLVPLLLDVAGMADLVRCQNRMREIGLAYHRYQREHGGLWPPLMTNEAPADMLARIEKETGLKAAPARPAADWGQPGPHWSIVLYPYLGDFRLCTCPADPKNGERGKDVIATGGEHAAALLDAPPESYALNVVLFRTQDDLRRQAGCTWGTHGDVDFNGLQTSTTQAEQRLLFPRLDDRILFFCGASGMTLGSQFNVPFRNRPGLAGCQRWEWHPRRASAAFADEPGCGSNYLFHGGHVEYRDDLPGLWEWGYDLGASAQYP